MQTVFHCVERTAVRSEHNAASVLVASRGESLFWQEVKCRSFLCRNNQRCCFSGEKSLNLLILWASGPAAHDPLYMCRWFACDSDLGSCGSDFARGFLFSLVSWWGDVKYSMGVTRASFTCPPIISLLFCNVSCGLKAPSCLTQSAAEWLASLCQLNKRKTCNKRETLRQRFSGSLQQLQTVDGVTALFFFNAALSLAHTSLPPLNIWVP